MWQNRFLDPSVPTYDRIVCAAVLAAFSCFGEVQPTTLQVDVNNFVLYNYDTFDTAQFGMNPSATNVMMKTYNYHVSIADIVAVGGAPAKGTLLCTHTMFLLNPTAVAGGELLPTPNVPWWTIARWRF